MVFSKRLDYLMVDLDPQSFHPHEIPGTSTDLFSTLSHVPWLCEGKCPWSHGIPWDDLYIYLWHLPIKTSAIHVGNKLSYMNISYMNISSVSAEIVFCITRWRWVITTGFPNFLEGGFSDVFCIFT